MKKYLLIMALFAALLLILTGCPTGGGGEVNTGGDTAEFWLALDDDGTPAPNDQLILDENGSPGADDDTNYVRIFFKAPKRNFDEISIDFTISDGGANVSWQSIHCGTLEERTGIWGATSGQDYIDWLENGPIECDPGYLFTSKWDGTDEVVKKADMIMLCIRVNPNGPGKVFTLTNVEFIGMEAPPVLQRISVIDPPSKTGYIVGEAFISTGLVIEAFYDKSRFDGVISSYTMSTSTIANLTNGYVFKEADVGTNIAVTVRYSEGGITEEDTFNIDVLAFGGEVTDVTVVNPPSKLSYYVGEDFSTAGLNVTAKIDGIETPVGSLVNLSTSIITNLTNSRTFLAGDLGAEQAVIVSFQGVPATSSTFNITVRTRPLIIDVINTANLGNFENAYLSASETTSLVYRTSDASQPAISVLPNPADQGGSYRLTITFDPPIDVTEFTNFNFTLSQNLSPNLSFRMSDNAWKQQFGVGGGSLNFSALFDGTSKAISFVEFWLGSGTVTAGELFVNSINFSGVYVPPEFIDTATGISITGTPNGTPAASNRLQFGAGTVVQHEGSEAWDSPFYIYFNPPTRGDKIKINLNISVSSGWHGCNLKTVAVEDGDKIINHEVDVSYSQNDKSITINLDEVSGINKTTVKGVHLMARYGTDTDTSGNNSLRITLNSVEFLP